MTKLGDSFIAIDTWILANLENDPIKQILGKFVDLNEFKKSLKS